MMSTTTGLSEREAPPATPAPLGDITDGRLAAIGALLAEAVRHGGHDDVENDPGRAAMARARALTDGDLLSHSITGARVVRTRREVWSTALVRGTVRLGPDESAHVATLAELFAAVAANGSVGVTRTPGEAVLTVAGMPPDLGVCAEVYANLAVQLTAAIVAHLNDRHPDDPAHARAVLAAVFVAAVEDRLREMAPGPRATPPLPPVVARTPAERYAAAAGERAARYASLYIV